MKNKSLLVGLAAYLVLIAAGPALKLLHVGRFAHWGWWRATVLLWLPWALVAAWLAYTVLALLLTKREEMGTRDEYYDGTEE